MSKNNNVKILFICLSIICYLPNLLLAQEEDPEKMFWQQDSVLTQQMDTVGSEEVLIKMRNGLDNALLFCRGPEDFINTG